MSISYELATTSAANPATLTNYIEFIGNSTRRSLVREIGLSSQVATQASKIMFGRPAASGVTPTSPITFLADDPADAAGTVKTAIAWGTNPTAPTNPHRQWEFNNVIGSSVIWTWAADAEFKIPATGIVTATVWNGGAITGPTMSVYMLEIE